MPKPNRPPAVATAGQALTTDIHSMAHGAAAVNVLQPLIDMIADAVVARLQSAPVPNEWLDEATMLAEYGMAKNGAAAKGLLPTRIGRKNKWRRSDIEAAISASPVAKRAHPKKCKMVANGDELDALIASGAVTR